MEERECNIGSRVTTVLKVGYFEKYARNTLKILNCGAGKTSRSSVGLLM